MENHHGFDEEWTPEKTKNAKHNRILPEFEQEVQLGLCVD